jgi:hypothetical protein
MHIFEWCLGWFKKASVVDIDVPGLQYRHAENHLQYRHAENHLQYRHAENHLHYRVTKD